MGWLVEEEQDGAWGATAIRNEEEVRSIRLCPLWAGQLNVKSAQRDLMR